MALELKNRASATSSDGRNFRFGAAASCSGASGCGVISAVMRCASGIFGGAGATGGAAGASFLADQMSVANKSALAALRVGASAACGAASPSSRSCAPDELSTLTVGEPTYAIYPAG
ncbi:MAG TPA: hypothetical protein VFR50_12225, partial [Casimicrobiaceae bacterium]|nr:hypothetical protein [Casimicrobiaceae bacterium]